MFQSNRVVRSGIVLLWAISLPSVVGCQATSGWTFNNSGRAYYQRGNYAMARDEFYRATLDDPRNADYRHNLAMAMKKTGDVAGAERVLRQNLTTVSAMHQPSYHSLSQLLMEQNRQAEAYDILQGWAVAQPYVPESHIEMAWVQREMGNSVGAEQSLRQALQIDPRNPIAMAHLGELYQDSGQPDRAAAMYQRSLATRWQQPQVQSRLKMIADGSGRNVAMSRSAMMQNPVSIQPAAYAYGSPMPMVMQPTNMSVMTTPPVTDNNAVMAAAPMLDPAPTPVETTNFEAPMMANGPSLIPNADPAHAAPEMAGDLPEVDAH